jgi:glycosyltransferase involved in cell wall biosynthesis
MEKSVESHKLAVLTQHPIQYHSPLYRRYNESERIDITVYYCSRRGVEAYSDEGLGGATVEWDRPLIEGYETHFLRNWSPQTPVEDGFFSLVNPAIVSKLFGRDFDALSVHGHNFFTYHLAFAAARLTGLPLFYSSDTHLLLDRPPLKRALRKPLLTLFYTQFQAFLSIGTKNREFYQAHGVPDEKIFHVPYTVDNEFFQSKALSGHERREFKRREGLDVDKPVILYVARLTERKRPGDLLEAFEQAAGSGLEAQLVYVGDGDIRGEMQRRAAKSSFADDINFMGFRNQSELPAWYSLADVFVLPSENEPWAVVVNEAMNGGTPVLATSDVGAAHDLVEPGKTGYMYEPGDVDQLGDYLQQTLADPEALARMGTAARQRISEWSYDEAVEGMERALDYVTGRRRKRWSTV